MKSSTYLALVLLLIGIVLIFMGLQTNDGGTTSIDNKPPKEKIQIQESYNVTVIEINGTYKLDKEIIEGRI
jgi:hypothetical protein